MKNFIQKILRVFGYEAKKYDPFPNTFIPINILDFILFKITNLKVKINCKAFDFKGINKENIIYKTLLKYNVKVNFVNLNNKNFLKLFSKNICTIFIVNKNCEDFLKKIIKHKQNQTVLIVNSKQMSKKTIYDCNILMLRNKFQLAKYWNYIIYFKNI